MHNLITLNKVVIVSCGRGFKCPSRVWAESLFLPKQTTRLTTRPLDTPTLRATVYAVYSKGLVLLYAVLNHKSPYAFIQAHANNIPSK